MGITKHQKVWNFQSGRFWRENTPFLLLKLQWQLHFHTLRIMAWEGFYSSLWFIYLFLQKTTFFFFLNSWICRSEIQEGLGEMLCLCSIWENPNGWNLLESSSFTIWHLGWGDSKGWAVILDEKNLIVVYKMSHFIIHIKNCFYWKQYNNMNHNIQH